MYRNFPPTLLQELDNPILKEFETKGWLIRVEDGYVSDGQYGTAIHGGEIHPGAEEESDSDQAYFYMYKYVCLCVCKLCISLRFNINIRYSRY